MQKLKVAVIGCGYWGKNLVRNFSEIGVLKYVCDSDTDRAKVMGKTKVASIFKNAKKDLKAKKEKKDGKKSSRST